jgi:hypothetical protein
MNFEGEFRDKLQLVALWPEFLQRKQRPSRIHLARSLGVSLERVTVSMSMVSESRWFLGLEEKQEGGVRSPFKAKIRIF